MNNKIYTYVSGEEGKLPYENAHLILPIGRMEEVCGFKPMQVAPKYLRTTRAIEKYHGRMQWWMVVARQDHDGNVGIDYVPKVDMYCDCSNRESVLDAHLDTLKELYERIEDYMSKYRFNKIVAKVRERYSYAKDEKEGLVADVADACVEYMEEKERPMAESVIKEIADTYGLESVTERYWRFDEKMRVEGWGF